MTKEKSITGNFIFNFIKTAMSLLFPIITFVYASRVLSVDGIGKVNFTKSISTYFVMLAQLGIMQYGAREAAKIRNDRERLSKFVHEMLLFNAGSTLGACVIFFAVLWLVPQLENYRALLLLWGISVLLNGLGMEWLYTALEEYRYMAMRSILFQLAALVLLPLLVRDSDDVLPYAGISLLAGSGVYILNFVCAGKYVSWKRFPHYQLRKHLKPVLLLFGFMLSVNLYTVLDISMLGFVSGDRAVGLYTTAEKVHKLVNSLIASLGAVLMPRLSLYIEQGRKQEFRKIALKAYKFVFFCSIPAALGLFMLAPEIIVLFSGADFAAAAKTMRVLAPIVLVIPISMLTNNQILLPMRKDNKILFSTCMGAVINISSNAVLMPLMAENGAAVGTVLAESVVMCICLHQTKKLFGFSSIFRGYWKYWVAALPIVFVYWGAKAVVRSEVMIIAVTVLLGAAFYVMLLYLEREETICEMVGRLKVILQKINRRH